MGHLAILFVSGEHSNLKVRHSSENDHQVSHGDNHSKHELTTPVRSFWYLLDTHNSFWPKARTARSFHSCPKRVKNVRFVPKAFEVGNYPKNICGVFLREVKAHASANEEQNPRICIQTCRALETKQCTACFADMAQSGDEIWRNLCFRTPNTVYSLQCHSKWRTILKNAHSRRMFAGLPFW